MKILITGASGFIGRDLCSKLCRDHSITAVYRNNKIDSSFNSIRADLRDEKTVSSLINQVSPDLIYHLAYDRNDLNPSIVDSAKNIVKSIKKSNFNPKIIYLSTDSVFDGNNPPYDENSKPVPMDDYGRAKFEAEKIFTGIDAMIIRTALVFGVDKPDNNLNILLNGLKTEKFNFKYFTDEIRTPVYLDDLTEILKKAPEFYQDIKILHVHGKETMSRYELACGLSDIFNYKKNKVPFSTQVEAGVKRPANLEFKSVHLNKFNHNFRFIKELTPKK